MIEKSETIGKLMAALAKVQAAVPTALKDSDNPFFKSKYADLASIGQAAFPLLGENGLAVVQVPGSCADKQMALYTLLGHSSGEFISGEMEIPLPKFDAQAYGSALTYARRYALGSFVGVLTDDDDGNAASRPNDSAVENNASREQPFVTGPAKNKTGLKAMTRELGSEIMGCGDVDELDIFLQSKDTAELIEQLKENLPSWWEGEGDSKGIAGLIQQKRDEFNQKAA